MPAEKSVGIVKGFERRRWSWRSRTAAIEGKAMRLAGVGDYFEGLVGSPKLWCQHRGIETVDRLLVPLLDQDWRADPCDLLTRHLLILGGVIALRIR